MGSPTRRRLSKLGRPRAAAAESCEPSEVNLVYVHGKPEVKVNLRRDSLMTAPSSSSGEADKTADEAPTMQAEAARPGIGFREERRAREIAEGILGLRRESNPDAQAPIMPSAKPQTPIALEDCDESRVNEIADGINRLISNVEKKRATHHVPQHSKPRAVEVDNVEPASPTCPIGVWKDGKISVSLQAERMFYTIVGDERNVPSTVTSRDGISVASEVTMEGAAQMNVGRKCRPPPPKNAVQRPVPPPPPRRRSSSFTRSPGTPSYPPPRRQLPNPSTLPPPPLATSANREQRRNLSESCPAFNKEQSCDATRSSSVSGTPRPKRMPPPPPPSRRPDVAPKKRPSSFSMSCPENIASEYRQDDATKSLRSFEKDASFVRPRSVQGRVRTPSNADEVEDTPKAKQMPPPRAPRSCPSTPVRIGSPNSAFSRMSPASGHGVDRQKPVKAALSSDHSNRSPLKGKESRIANNGMVKGSTPPNDKGVVRQTSAKTALSTDSSNRSPVEAKEFRIGNNRMVKDSLPKQGQFDRKGRCPSHPSEILAKKKLLGRGWKIIQDRCPQCKKQQQVKKMKKRASEGSSDSHARSVSGASYVRMQSLSGAAAEMLGNDSGGSDSRCGNDGKVHPMNEDSKRIPPSPWSETKVEDVPKKKPAGAPPRRKKDHHAKAPTVRPRSFRMAPPPRQEKFLYEVQLRNNF